MFDDRHKLDGPSGEQVDENMIHQLEYLLEEARAGNVKSVLIAMTHVDGRWKEDAGCLIGQPSDVPLLTAQAAACISTGMKNFRQFYALSEHPLGKAN